MAKQLGDLALEAQACYSLGNSSTLLRDYNQAIDYHLKHLQIAQELQDKLGQVGVLTFNKATGLSNSLF